MAARIALMAAALLVLAGVAPAFGQDTGSAIAALGEDPLYVEAGAETVDESAMRDAIDAARDSGVDLRVAVLASGPDAPALAATIAAGLDSATVLGFTPTAYGVFSDELSQSRLDEVLADAEDALSGPDAAAGAAAFAAALDSGGVSAGVVAAIIIGLLVIVGVAGRLWDARTRDARQARRRDRRRAELIDRTRRLADQVLELSDPVELSQDPDFSGKYAAAAARFDEAELAIAQAATMHDLDAVEQRLEEAETLLAEVTAGLPRSGRPAPE